MKQRRPIRHVLAAAVTVIALPLAGCGDDDVAAAPETTTTTAAPTTTTEAAPAPVAVKAVDYAYVGLPATVEAGTAFTLENTSETELHELVAVRLPDDETRSAAELLALPPEEVAAFFPGVTTVIIAPPGDNGFPVEGTGVLDEPGRYLILCAIPTGADPAEYLAAAAESEGGPPDVPGGPPHFVQGMFGEITVEG